MSNNQVKDEKALLLVKKCIKNTFKNYTIQLQNITNPSDGFTGITYLVTIDGDGQDGLTKKLHLFIKTAPQVEYYRQFIQIRKIYCREIFVYDAVIPEFLALLSEKHLDQGFSLFAKSYITTTENCEEAIVMENMKEKDFKVYCSRLDTDYPHALLVMKELGRFHALSYALRDQKPEIYKYLEKNCAESFLNSSVYKIAIQIMTSLGKAVLDTYDPIQEKKEFETLQRSLQDLPSVLKSLLLPETYGKYSVINHGDFQIRNVLFKYGSGSPACPKEACFIDWQVARTASPVLDIQTFLSVNTDKAFRTLHYKNLLLEYYESLCVFLRLLGSEPEALIPFKILQDDLKKYGTFAFYFSLWVLRLNMEEESDIPIYQDGFTEEALLQHLCQVPNKAFIERVRDLVSFYIECEFKI